MHHMARFAGFAALRVTLLERGPGCHPEHSAGSGSPDAEILRCAQDDKHSLRMTGILSKYPLAQCYACP